MLDFATLTWIQPEMLLVLTASLMFLVGACMRPRRTLWSIVAIAAYVAAAGIVAFREWPIEVGFTMGPLVVDLQGQLFRALALAAGLVFTLLVSGTMNRRLPAEFVGLVMLAVAGVMLCARANDLAMLFVSLELVSIPTYVLLFLARTGRPAAESTMKYFYLSIFSSAILLYGLSFFYGLGGTTTLTGESSIAEALASRADAWQLLGLGLVFVLAGLGFKMAAAPFHFYAADVYQGTSNAVAGFLSVAPKAAGLAALLRLVQVLPDWSDTGWRLVVALAMVTMTVGNVGALWQTNLRRMLAFSSIAHSGYLLIGVAVALAARHGNPSYAGAAAALLYLATYIGGSLGAFGVGVLLTSEGRRADGLDDLAGLAKTHPGVAAGMAVMMFSLAGIPPLAGFWGKLTLLTSSVSLAITTTEPSVRTWFVALALVGAVNAAIGAAYYLRVVGAMYFRAPADALEAPACRGATFAVGLCAAAVVLLGVMPGLLLQWMSGV